MNHNPQPGTPCDRGECRCGTKGVDLSKRLPPAQPYERKRR